MLSNESKRKFFLFSILVFLIFISMRDFISIYYIFAGIFVAGLMRFLLTSKSLHFKIKTFVQKAIPIIRKAIVLALTLSCITLFFLFKDFSLGPLDGLSGAAGDKGGAQGFKLKIFLILVH